MAIGTLKAGVNSQDVTASTGSDVADTVNYVYETVEALPSAAVITNRAKTGMLKTTFFGNSYVNRPTGFVKPFASKSNDVYFLKNAGNGGDESAELLARLNDVPDNTDLVFVFEGVNDSIYAVTPEVHAANTKAILENLVGRGFRTALILTGPNKSPLNSTLGDPDLIKEYNLYDWVTCFNLGVECYGSLSQFFNDDGTGWFASGVDEDGVHLSNESFRLFGYTLAADRYAKNYAYPLAFKTNTGLLADAMFTTGTASTFPTGWAQGGTITKGCSVTSLGKGKTITISGNANALAYAQSPEITTVIGKRYVAMCKYSCDIAGTDAKAELYMRAVSNSSNRQYLLQDAYVSQEAGVYMLEWVADVTAYKLFMTFSGSDYNITANLAQLTVFCLDDYEI